MQVGVIGLSCNQRPVGGFREIVLSGVGIKVGKVALGSRVFRGKLERRLEFGYGVILLSFSRKHTAELDIEARILGAIGGQAAEQGLGIALARGAIAAPEIAAGRLVRLFPDRVPPRSAYYLVYPRANAALPAVEAFREWIMAEVTPGGRKPLHEPPFTPTPLKKV